MTPAGPAPQLAVVVATHQRSRAAAALVRALLAEPSVGELIVVDDGSTDGTATEVTDAAAGDSRLRLISQANAGRQRARAIGAARAAAELLLFLDDDVIPVPGALDGHLAHHAARRGLVLLGGMTTSPDRWTPAARIYDRHYREHAALWTSSPCAVLEHFWMGHFSIRQSDLEAVGGLVGAVELGYHEDREFGHRCRDAGLAGGFDATLGAVHRYERSAAGFLRDARSQGVDRARLAWPEAKRAVNELRGLRPAARVARRAFADAPGQVPVRALAVASEGLDRLQRPRGAERLLEHAASLERYRAARDEAVRLMKP